MYDEIIADSEGEDELFGPIAPAPVVGLKTTTPSAASTSANVSAISEFSTSKATAIDSISNFSSAASRGHATSTIITTTTTATTTRPRPKPKPLTRNIGHTSAISSGNNSNNAPTGNTSHIEMFDMALSIADRAKMRKRNKDGNHTSSSSAAPVQLDFLEISSDDELALPAKRPKKSKNATKKSSSLTTAATTSNHMRYDSSDPDPNSSYSLPVVATSPTLARNGIRASLIMLPPSDPPQSTPSEDFDIPAIETLPNPPSSASTSAVSESFNLRAHRDLSGPNIPPTPAPFFADPSSTPFPLDNDLNIPNNNTNNTNSREIHTTRVIDSVLMPPPPVPSPVVQPEAKKSRTKKKKVNDDDDEYMMDGEDWTGAEPKGKGKKSKSKANDKDKTATSKDKGKSTRSSTKAKGKGREKEVQAVSKSREFIEDDEDIDEMLMSTITIPPRNTSAAFSPTPQPYAQPQRSSPGSKRARDASDGQGDDLDDVNEVPRQGTWKKMRKSDDEARDAFGAADGVVDLSGSLDLDVNMGQSTSSKSSLKKGKKGKKGRVVMSEDEDEDAVSGMYMENRGRDVLDSVSIITTKSNTKPKSNAKKRVVSGEEEGHVTATDGIGSLKASFSFTMENILLSRPDNIPQTPISRPYMANSSSIQATLDTPAPDQKHLKYPSLTSRYTIAPKSARKSTPMSDLIRRVNSMPNSQFKSPIPRGGNRSGGGNTTPTTTNGAVGSLTAYSPYLKSSRSFLSRIAPLHPNRRTPPPLPPAPPSRKKTRKEIEWEKKDKEEREEMEERWEEELVERVGGMGEWLGMTEDMRKMMKRAKRDRELGLGGWEE
ncbi:hypothetical protein EV368DRAFT_84858 [Lentinula lateritia]|uniref:Uncharacterized protein n=1 Tax=Lentinula aff. lateritia TaxID=2804960 RepID=A0ACC1U9C7_9AGAR|nr:hypothetical protein F5876DRAFT_73628 [Lentinula aff. lateritia]KAJ3850115.1 hypothetical protein EV368DRAFT_84858 [Lentinula lateritia]